MTDSTDFVELYVPENLQYIDPEQQYESVYTKLVGLFQEVLSGQVTDKIEFLTRVDELYTYWDVLSKPQYIERVRTLLDPFDISGLITKNTEETGRLLYFIANIYSIKGTIKAFKYILRLVGMDADIIRWYEPEYKRYRPAEETCYSIIKLYVGDNPVTDESVEIFNRLVELLLDICTVIPAWVYIKNLTDDVYSAEELTEDPLAKFTEVIHHYNDYYSQCSMEIDARGLTGKYGVYVHPSRDLVWQLVGRWSDPVSLTHDRHDFTIDPEPCTDYHDGKIQYLYPRSHLIDYIGYRDNLAGLIYISDTIIRHGYYPSVAPPCSILFDGQYRYNQRLDLPHDYYGQCHERNYVSPCSFDYDPLTGALLTVVTPIFSGRKEQIYLSITVPFYTEHGEASAFPPPLAKTPLLAAPCDREPSTWVIADWTMREKYTLAVGHDGSCLFTTSSLKYAPPNDIYYDHLHTLTLDDIADSYVADHGDVLDTMDVANTPEAKQALEQDFTDTDPFVCNRPLVFAPPDLLELDLDANTRHYFGRYFSYEGDCYFYNGTGSSVRLKSRTASVMADDRFILHSKLYYSDERYEYEAWPDLQDYPVPFNQTPFNCVDHTPVIQYSLGEHVYTYRGGLLRGIHWKHYVYNSPVDHLNRIYYQLYRNPKKYHLDYGGQALATTPRFDWTFTYNGEIDHLIRYDRHIDLRQGRVIPEDLALQTMPNWIDDAPDLTRLYEQEVSTAIIAGTQHAVSDEGSVLTALYDGRVYFDSRVSHNSDQYEQLAPNSSQSMQDVALPILDDGSLDLYFDGVWTYGEIELLGARADQIRQTQVVRESYLDSASIGPDSHVSDARIDLIESAPLAAFFTGDFAYSGAYVYESVRSGANTQFEDKKTHSVTTFSDLVILPGQGQSITYAGDYQHDSETITYAQPDSVPSDLDILVIDYGYDLRFDSHFAFDDGFIFSGARLLKPGSPAMLEGLH